MNNDSNGIVLGYLEFIGECILQALTGPGKEELIAAKRVASLALVDGLNVCACVFVSVTCNIRGKASLFPSFS